MMSIRCPFRCSFFPSASNDFVIQMRARVQIPIAARFRSAKESRSYIVSVHVLCTCSAIRMLDLGRLNSGTFVVERILINNIAGRRISNWQLFANEFIRSRGNKEHVGAESKSYRRMHVNESNRDIYRMYLYVDPCCVCEGLRR